MEASSPIAGKAHRSTWEKHVRGFEQLGLTTLPSSASPFAGRSPATPRSASWPPRRVFWRIPSKSPPFSCSLAVPRAWKGGLQARQIHQKALASRSEETSQSPHLNFGLIGTLPNPRVVRTHGDISAASQAEIRGGSRPGLPDTAGDRHHRREAGILPPSFIAFLARGARPYLWEIA